MYYLATAALTVAAASGRVTAGDVNVRPVVGIYAAPFHHSSTGCSGSKGCDYVAASYVKWLESAGARSLPILYDSTSADIDAIFPQINGVLLPGGGSSLPDGAKRIVELAMQASDNGTHFPVWGTCLGFEWLMEIVGGSDVLGSGFDSENITMALNLTSAASSSRLLGATKGVDGHRDRSEDAAAQLRTDLSNTANPPAMNNHQAGVTPATFKENSKLNSFFDVLSTNVDRKGRAFVSTVESKTYPVYGTQWHPEKNNFEWGMRTDGTPYEVINHTPEAVHASQALANYFVGECRRNSHKVQEGTKLFWNYPISLAAAPEFEECYTISL